MGLMERAEQWESTIDRWLLRPTFGTIAGRDPRTTTTAAPTVDERAARLAREVLPRTGGTVADVGCGTGAASVALAARASEIIGIDTDVAALDEFRAAIAQHGIARRTVEGRWPDLAAAVPVVDVAVSHHVAYFVADIVPFLDQLTTHARLAVVVVVPARHPWSAWRAAIEHLHDVELPDGPSADDLIGVTHDLGYRPDVERYERPGLHRWEPGPDQLEVARQRCGVPPERLGELAGFLRTHPPEFVAEFVAIRWPGDAPAT